MAEEGTLCINADVAKFAGSGANATATAEAYTNVYIKMAEAFICTLARYDWVTNYASVSTIGKEILRNATACWAAIQAIEYDMRGFPSKEDAQTRLDVLWSQCQECAVLLRDDKFRKFVLTGSVA